MFARIGRLFRGFVSLFISGIEESNPEALMAAARDDFRSKMAQYNMALARMAGVAERLKGQVKGKTAKAHDLERRIMANHAAGNMELAGSLARELQELKVDLTTDTEELKETEEAYQNNLRQAELVQREFEDKVRRLEKQLSQVQIKERAEAAAALEHAFKVVTRRPVKDVEAWSRTLRDLGGRRASPGHGQHAEIRGRTNEAPTERLRVPRCRVCRPRLVDGTAAAEKHRTFVTASGDIAAMDTNRISSLKLEPSRLCLSGARSPALP